MELRDYQVEAVEKIVRYAVEHPSGRLLLTIPMGGGKTVVAAAVIRILVADHGLRGLVVVHRRELVNQHYAHLVRCGVPSEMIGVILSGDARANPSAPIQIASVDTLYHRKKKPRADFVLTDESQRDASNGRRKLRALYGKAFKLGLTATPWRLDGRGLKADYDDLIVISSMMELIADGHLSSPKVRTVPNDRLPDVSDVKVVHGDFAIGDLDRVANRTNLIGNIIEHWQRHADERRTIVFAVSIAHSKAIVARFVAAGIRAVHIDQKTPNAVREAVLAALDRGDVQVVSCVNILTEGWDCLSCKCVVLARPTKSLAMYLQQCGRCMRPWKDVTPLILDHAGNVIRERHGHGLPQEDREWVLAEQSESRKGGPMAKACSCGAVVPMGTRICPECGFVFVDDSPPEEEDEQLVEYHERISEDTKRAEYARIAEFARVRSFPEEWVARVFEAKFGTPPPALAS